MTVAGLLAVTLSAWAYHEESRQDALETGGDPETGWNHSWDPSTLGVWITPEEVSLLPTEGAAWDALLAAAAPPLAQPHIADLTDDEDVLAMAKALVYARTGDPAYRAEVIDACMAAIGTEDGGSALGLARNLVGYVIAADLVQLPPPQDGLFRQWLAQVRHEDLQGRTLISTHEDRPNNWGTHAGAARAAIAVYLGDVGDLAAAATVFRGWLGDRDAYAGFEYGELWWQADPDEPVGINPAGSTIGGFPVDGVLPDDQRRAGPFQWPPPQTNYVYEALQGAVAQAVILSRQGFDVWEWEDRALLRAVRWLHDHANYPATGDDGWQPHVINHRYGTLFPAPLPATPGKNVGWTDWTHSSCNADLNASGSVDAMDTFDLLAAWGTDPGGPPDFDLDGTVGGTDLLALLANWGNCLE
jgi:hypothetical protein